MQSCKIMQSAKLCNHAKLCKVQNYAIMQGKSLCQILLKCRFRFAISSSPAPLSTFPDKRFGWDRRRQTDWCIRLSSLFISPEYLGRMSLCRKPSSSLSPLLPSLISNSTFETWDMSGVRAEILSSRRLARWIRTRPPPRRTTRASVRRTRAGRRPWEASADMRTHEQEEE